MTKFSGFLPGKQPTFAVYAQFISDLLPLIDNVTELKVTLYAMWAIQQREGTFRYLLRRDFTANTVFMAGVGGETALDDGLTRACEPSIAAVRGIGTRRNAGAPDDQYGNGTAPPLNRCGSACGSRE